MMENPTQRLRICLLAACVLGGVVALPAQSNPHEATAAPPPAAAAVGPAAASGDPPWDPLAGRVSIDLRDASPADLFGSFESVLYDTVHRHVPGIERDAVRIVLDPGIREPVTVCLQNVTLRTAITAVCESIDCAWEFKGRSGPFRIEITVRPLERAAARAAEAPAEGSRPASLDEPIHAQFEKAEAGMLFGIVSRMSGYQVVVAPELTAKIVSIDLEAPLRNVFDAICKQVQCSWSVRDGVLTVRPR